MARCLDWVWSRRRPVASDLQGDGGASRKRGWRRVRREDKRAGKGVGRMAQITSDLVEDRRNRVLGEAAEERAEERGRPGGR